MLLLRLNIISKILSSAKPEFVKSIIDDELDEATLNYDRTVNSEQLIENLKSDILFQLMSKQNYEHYRNLKEALTIIQSYGMKPYKLEIQNDEMVKQNEN